jgi:hypothetical protein
MDTTASIPMATRMPKRKPRKLAEKKSAAAQGGRAGKKDGPKTTERVKSTIVMDRDLDFLLGSIAHHQDMERSELAVSLIERGLRDHYGPLYEALRPFTVKMADKASRDDSGVEEDRTR